MGWPCPDGAAEAGLGGTAASVVRGRERKAMEPGGSCSGTGCALMTRPFEAEAEAEAEEAALPRSWRCRSALWARKAEVAVSLEAVDADGAAAGAATDR